MNCWLIEQEKGRTRAGSQEKGRGSGRAESLDKVDSRPSVFSRLGNKVHQPMLHTSEIKFSPNPLI